MLEFLLICFFLGLPFYLLYFFLRKNKSKNSIFVEHQTHSEKERKDTFVNAIVLKPKSTNKIPIYPYVEKVVGISIFEVLRQNDKFNFLDINIYIQNLSDEMSEIKLEKAFYVTENGEQIRGDVRNLLIMGTENNIVMPYLKVKKTIHFYNLIKDVYENEVLTVQIKVNDTPYILSTYIG